MVTANTIIHDALTDINVKSPSVSLTTEETARGIRAINRLMTTWDEEGLSVGFHKIENGEDDLGIPDWFEDCLISHLAIRLAPGYKIQTDPRRIEIANEMMRIIESRLFTIPDVILPSTLPLGSGNEWNGSDRKFYPGRNRALLETGSQEQILDDESIDLST